MIQEIAVGFLFFAAMVYVARMIFNQWKTTSTPGCAKGCGGCSVLDNEKVNQLVEQIETRKK
jgi:hypothetical protein